MLKITRRADHHHGTVTDAVVLPYQLRQKGRFKAESKAGQEVGIFLVRGEVLREGDFLFSECGQIFAVEAEAEPVVTAVATDWLTFSKACYHLGNRHVPMAIGELWLRFQPDHVLEDMVQMFGLTVTHHNAPFNPENGAYHGGGHHHGHSHDEHNHSHGEHAH
ncbi:urease accessory protein UreE [Reinekea marinisedimentorum]|uniref:Urease accessory protein UreE n=1 Tax=Reinekea marinisedimentorum TaxID=230495 RepID=A0A4R3I000_9GAMM|nr:urease accessory protein UreE [Reinekea marinisedimentorum]TCS38997.1 urease accessory protein [Reinekea marinisedimentorum]